MALAGWLEQSTAVDILLGPFVDDTDGKTPETGLAISQADVRLSKNGQNMAQKNDVTACVHDELGQYNCELDATDTNTLGVLTVTVVESGALPIRQDYMIVPANTYDSLIAPGTDYLEVDTILIEATDATTVLDTQIDDRLDTAIGGAPTAGSIFERVKAIDDKLPTNFIMGSSVVTDKDDEIDAIKVSTDNLPGDPASETNVNANETKIDTAITDIGNLNNISAADVNAQVDAALNTAIPGSPTADSINDLMKRINGMVGQNVVYDDFTFDGDKNQTVGNLYVYNTKANATTHDKSTGLIAKISIAGTYSATLPTLIKKMKES